MKIHFIFPFFLILFLCACQKPTAHNFKNNFFTMEFNLLVGDSLTQLQQKSIEKAIEDTFKEVDAVLNNWNPDSEISKFNRLPANHILTPSKILLDLLVQVQSLYTLTEGRFDPTVAPLCTVWKKALSQGKTLSAKEIETLLPSIGWEHIHLKDHLLWKDHHQTQIDLGGIAKGYAVDLLYERLDQLKLSSFFIEWGGEVRAKGNHPSGRPWQVGILGIGATPLCNEAIATSGDYYQSWEIEGKTYTHIIDPRTKEPLKKSECIPATTSIKARNCTLADGLATALMLCQKPEEIDQIISKLQPVDYWIGYR